MDSIGVSDRDGYVPPPPPPYDAEAPADQGAAGAQAVAGAVPSEGPLAPPAAASVRALYETALEQQLHAEPDLIRRFPPSFVLAG